MYDPKTTKCEEAAWLVVSKKTEGTRVAFFEAHLTEDEQSPNGYGWYFASYMKDSNGQWNEYDGGIYWDYENASDLDVVIGDTVPFREFTCQLIDNDAFDEICIKSDAVSEKRLFDDMNISPAEPTAEKRAYCVTITETLKRDVEVQASSRDEAQAIVNGQWKNEKHILSADDFKEVHFTVAQKASLLEAGR